MMKFGIKISIFIFLSAFALAYSQESSANKDICLTDYVEPIVDSIAAQGSTIATKEDIKISGNCDSILITLWGTTKLAEAKKKGECEIDIQFTSFVKRLASVNDTLINACAINSSVLPVSSFSGISFHYLPDEGFHLSLLPFGGASWASLEIRDARGRLLHANLQPFTGTSLEFDWRPVSGIFSPHFFTIALGKGSEIIKKATGSFF